MLVEVAVAVQVLLLAAVLPAVSRDLGGLSLYGWALGAAGVGVVASTPLAGHAVSRWRPRTVLVAAVAVSLAGLGSSALAPSMIVLVAGRFVVGCGLAAVYTVSLTSAVRELSSGAQARVFAITGLAWVIPGIVGPPTGAVLASTVGWRWALAAPIPMILVALALLLPVLRGATRTATGRRAPLAATGLTALAEVVLLSALAAPRTYTIVLALAAFGALVAGVRMLMPAGTFRAAAGLPAIIALQLAINFAYFAGDGFLPLALTSQLGRTLTQAGIAITLSAVAWSAAGWWQSRVATRTSPRLLVTGGAGLVVVGSLGVLMAIVTGWFPAAYIAWTLGGVGMGIAYQTSWVSGSALAEGGHEGIAVSRLLLAETLGSSLGAGVAGGVVSIARAAHATLHAGLVAAFVVVAIAALCATVIGRRQPTEPLGAA